MSLSSFLQNAANASIVRLLNPGLGSLVLKLFLIIALGLAAIILLLSRHQSNRLDEIAATAPMHLEVDTGTGYLKFDATQNSGFGTDAFLSAVKDKPVILTGGVPITVNLFIQPEITDSDDKSIKRVAFNTQSIDMYVPFSCVDQIAQANQVIAERIQSLPRQQSCQSNFGCAYVRDVQQFDPSLFENTACEGARILATELAPECKISGKGELQNIREWRSQDTIDHCHLVKEFIYVRKGLAIDRSRELELLTLQSASKRDLDEKNLESQKNVASAFDNDVNRSIDCMTSYNANYTPCQTCPYPTSEVHDLICSNANQDLRRLDGAVTGSYFAHMLIIPDAQKEKFKNEQIEWLYQLQQCEDTRCLSDSYNTRLSEIVNNYR